MIRKTPSLFVVFSPLLVIVVFLVFTLICRAVNFDSSLNR
jgi:hypothetical protein